MSDGELAARVVRLERAARRDRVLALGALALALATAQAPAARPIAVHDAGGATATMTARGLEVRDGAGMLRTRFGLDKTDYPSLDLFDASGTVRESMYLSNDRPVLRQFDKAGKRRAEMFLASGTENGELAIRDAKDVTRLAVFRGNSGLPELALYGTDGNVRAYVATDDTSPFLVMKDRAGTSRVAMGGFGSGKIGMELRSTGGTVLWSAP